MNRHNQYLSPYACKDEEAIRFKEESEDIRPPFFRDADRILYTYAYIRYMDKTQVFTRTENDHITKRSMHVQYVSKIARNIGRALGLNEDLIQGPKPVTTNKKTSAFPDCFSESENPYR